MFVLQIATLAVTAIKETHADLTWPLNKEGGGKQQLQHLQSGITYAEAVHMLFKWVLRLNFQV